jgi:hypothetical protein
MASEGPTLAEIEATVGRLEAKLASSENPRTAGLLAACRKLDVRFRADLADPRDLALSRGAALMLVKFVDDLDA